jgi:hypothetical protein
MTGYPWSAGEVLSAADLNSAILNAPGRVSSVAGHVGAVTLTHNDLTDWAAATAGFASPTYATISAAGTTQGTATAVTTTIAVVTTVAANSGVILPAGATQPVRVLNRGANTLNVYPQTGGQIEALGANAAATVAVGAGVTFLPVSSTQWYAA